MINYKNVEKYCKDYTKIENYEKAIEDETQVWECHHRLGIAPFSGKKISMKFLKEQGLYYNQPPEALIFLTTTEHDSLHQKGKEYSDELREKHRQLRLGKKLSEETKKKISEAQKGKKHSEERRRKNSESHKGQKAHNVGKKAFNNGKITIYSFECPDGFVKGGLPRKRK